jgi:hypothetical protein
LAYNCVVSLGIGDVRLPFSIVDIAHLVENAMVDKTALSGM